MSTLNNLNLYPQGGDSGILVTGMCEWDEIVRPKKSPSG